MMKQLDNLFNDFKLLSALFFIFVFGVSVIFGVRELTLGEYQNYYNYVFPPLLTLMIGFYLGFKMKFYETKKHM